MQPFIIINVYLLTNISGSRDTERYIATHISKESLQPIRTSKNGRKKTLAWNFIFIIFFCSFIQDHQSLFEMNKGEKNVISQKLKIPYQVTTRNINTTFLFMIF